MVELNLTSNCIGDDGCLAMASCLRTAPLRTLLMYNNRYSQEAAAAVFDAAPPGMTIEVDDDD